MLFIRSIANKLYCINSIPQPYYSFCFLCIPNNLTLIASFKKKNKKIKKRGKIKNTSGGSIIYVLFSFNC